jgi:hypothetical protein
MREPVLANLPIRHPAACNIAHERGLSSESRCRKLKIQQRDHIAGAAPIWTG